MESSPPETDVEGQLICCIKRNDHAAVCKIMDSLDEEEQRDLNSKDVNGKPLLFHACLAKATKIARYLIDDCGVDINSVNDVMGEMMTPLFLAIRTRNTFLLLTLIKFQVNLSWKDHENRNGIVFACWEKNYEAAKILRENGVDINSDKNIYYCASDKNYLKAALKLGTYLRYANSGGNTILMKATSNGKLDIINMLLNKNSYPYHRNNIGANALDLAIFKGSEEVITLLLNNLYTRYDYALSLEYCGAYAIIFTRDMDKCLNFWQEAIVQRRKYTNQIRPKTDFIPKDFPLNFREFDIETDLNMREEKYLLIDALLVLCRILSMKSRVTKKAFCCVALSTCIDMDIQTRFSLLIHVMQLNASDPFHNESEIFYSWHVFVKLTSKYFLILEVTDFEEIYVLSTNLVNIVREYVWPFLRSKPKHMFIHMERYKSLQIMILRYLQFLSHETSEPEYKRIVLFLARTLAKEECSAIRTTLLHLAVSKTFSCGVINLLIECRANIDAVDERGNTPLHLLIDRPRTDPDRDKIACLLILGGCGMDAKNGSNIVLREYFGSLLREIQKLKGST